MHIVIYSHLTHLKSTGGCILTWQYKSHDLSVNKAGAGTNYNQLRKCKLLRSLLLQTQETNTLITTTNVDLSTTKIKHGWGYDKKHKLALKTFSLFINRDLHRLEAMKRITQQRQASGQREERRSNHARSSSFTSRYFYLQSLPVVHTSYGLLKLWYSDI